MEISWSYKRSQKKSVITSETEGAMVCFGLNPHHNFVTQAPDRNINYLKKIRWLKWLADVTIWKDFSTWSDHVYVWRFKSTSLAGINSFYLTEVEEIHLAKISSLEWKKYTQLKYPKCKAKATIGMVDGIQKAIFKPDPQIKADSPRFFEKETWAWPTE